MKIFIFLVLLATLNLKSIKRRTSSKMPASCEVTLGNDGYLKYVKGQRRVNIVNDSDDFGGERRWVYDVNARKMCIINKKAFSIWKNVDNQIDHLKLAEHGIVGQKHDFIGGIITVDQGRITRITNETGHLYQHKNFVANWNNFVGIGGDLDNYLSPTFNKTGPTAINVTVPGSQEVTITYTAPLVQEVIPALDAIAEEDSGNESDKKRKRRMKRKIY